MVGSDSDDMLIVRGQRLLRRRGAAPHLDLGDRRALEAFDSDDVGLGEVAARSANAGGASSCRRPRSLPGRRRDDDGLDRAGARVPLAVRRCRRGGRRSWCVCLTVATFSPRLAEQRNEALDQRRLAGVFPADDADEHGKLSHARLSLANRPRAFSRSAGALTLKNGSMCASPISTGPKSATAQPCESAKRCSARTFFLRDSASASASSHAPQPGDRMALAVRSGDGARRSLWRSAPP